MVQSWLDMKPSGKHLKILFDGRYMRTDFHDGISRYSAELGTALSKIADVTFLLSDAGKMASKKCQDFIHP